MTRPMTYRIALVAAAAVLAVAPFAAAQSIGAGSDVWKTEGENTFVSFGSDPIPAGFFCDGSPAFAGTIELTSQPLATSPANALRGADTIVVRDADAPLVNGVATITGRLVALSLKGKSQLAVQCISGPTAWNIYVYASDSNLPSTFAAVQTGTLGGNFFGTLRVPAVIRFTNAADSTDVVELDNDIDFTIPSDSEWATQPGGDGWKSPAATVDANGDGVPDTPIPAASNFFPGKSQHPQAGCAIPPCPVKVRHQAPTHAHIVFPPPPPPPRPCRPVIVLETGETETTTQLESTGTVVVTPIEPSPSPIPSPIPCHTVPQL